MANDSVEPLVTECPSCGTHFRVTESQLETAGGKVRCGACLEVFLGAENFVLEGPEPDPGEDANEALDALLSELAGDATDVFGVPRENAGAIDDDPGMMPDEEGEPPVEIIEIDVAAAEADPLADVESIELSAPPELPDDVGEFADLSVENIEFVGSGGATDTSLELEDVEDVEAAEAEDVEPLPTEQFDGEGGAELASQGEETPQEAIDPSGPAVDLDVPLDFHFGGTNDDQAPDDGEQVALELAPESEPEIEPESDSEPEPELAEEPVVEDVEEIVLDHGGSTSQFDWTKQADADDPETAGPLSVDIAPAASRRRWIPVATVVATVALLMQVFWSQRDEWSTDPSIRPIYQFGCQIFRCSLAPLRAVDAIYSKNLVVRAHPDVPDALMVDALVINGAEFEQPYPVVELRFSSITGRTVAGRRFQPDEYLAGEAFGAQVIAPNTPVHISLSIQDPGSDAVNYVMLFH